MIFSQFIIIYYFLFFADLIGNRNKSTVFERGADCKCCFFFFFSLECFFDLFFFLQVNLFFIFLIFVHFYLKKKKVQIQSAVLRNDVDSET